MLEVKPTSNPLMIEVEVKLNGEVLGYASCPNHDISSFGGCIDWDKLTDSQIELIASAIKTLSEYKDPRVMKPNKSLH
jgi:hypothetical protein